MPARLADIAEEANVSVATVSRVLRDVPDARVSDATRERISRIAEALHYHPNPYGQALSYGRAALVSVVLRRTKYQIPTLKVFALLSELDKLGRDVGIAARVLGETPLEPVMKKLLVGAPEAVVLLQPPWSDEDIRTLCEALSEDGSNVLLVDPDDPSALPGDLPCDTVWVDRIHGFRLATSHLFECGHRHVALIAARQHATRFEGYEQAVADQGMHAPIVGFLDEATPVGPAARRAAQQLLQHDPRITALVCGSDLVAAAAMSAVRDMGLQVGRDVAVVGFDNEPWTAYLSVPLTTVAQPVAQLCQTAFGLLSDRLNGGGGPWQRVAVKPRLVIRETSGANIDVGG